jgi:hypothetical protein
VKSLILGLIILFAPSIALAHGGVSKDVGSATVYLKQSPLSPLVGEEVKFFFALAKTEGNAALRNLPIKLTLIDTYAGDESRDKTLLTKKIVTDVNGDFDFSFTFNEENYFDIDLSFADPVTGQEETTGFLVQPRVASGTLAIPNKETPSYSWIYAILGLAVGMGIANAFKKAGPRA